MELKERSSCRISQGPLIDVFDLGKLPLSCFPLPSDPSPEDHPVLLSLNEQSGLVQLRHTVSPDEMYNQYWYMSGMNASMKQALKSIVDEAIKRSRISLEKGDIVVDIASNDGTLLSFYPPYLFRVGIDPAKNIKPENCDLHINTYFNANDYVHYLGNKKAKIITSIAVFYDLEDPIQFAKDASSILDENGLWIIELSYLPTMLERNSFDTICAEHLEYYSMTSIEYVLSAADMEVEDVSLNDVNGGSFRLYIRHKGKANITNAVKEIRAYEKTHDFTKASIYFAFASRVENNKNEMLSFLKEQKNKGKKVIGYGASTKGNTILAYYGIGPELLPFIAERNPIKWGRQAVTRIPIISEEEARAMNPDYLLAFPYHFMKEFLERETDFLKKGGKFISPVPKLTVIP
ncbi:class I SAM-dependent methyltransferase [Candidatus Rhabdochlamydia porcellionis]|uniref:C-methyltransferase C-terminal domain n=1 Tax=Candidatus Rhabdochlamydia porcellionis TaxID=225148 RepID=A0ABX8Z130_9BACT|nr:class I SAM-dependent methyltransferase [Candidatus Rhabdochlamydia porcellionis]QZA59143.1 C-methyltransferase C-terminal domain [Candidatus Rhabdochlamydia porcellionis]